MKSFMLLMKRLLFILILYNWFLVFQAGVNDTVESTDGLIDS